MSTATTGSRPPSSSISRNEGYESHNYLAPSFSEFRSGAREGNSRRNIKKLGRISMRPVTDLEI
jgi:hypothetical protein